MSNMSLSLAAEPLTHFSANERSYVGDGVARRLNGTPYNPLTDEDLTPEQVAELRAGESIYPDDEAPCWATAYYTADANDDDAIVLSKPNIQRLHAPKYVMRPLLPRKSVTILAADSGTGKSTLAAHIEAMASRGDLDEGRPLKCLVVTTEDSQDDLAAQYAAEGANVDNIRILSIESLKLTTRDGSPALKTFGAGDLERIAGVAYKINPDIVRFDPLHRFAAGDWNAGKSAEFIDELTVMAQSLNCVVLGIMHTKKGATHAKEAITGTSQWVAKARSVAVMAAPDDDKNHAVLEQVKANRSATQNYEVEFATKPMRFDDGSVFEVRYVAGMTPTTRTADDVFQQNINDRAAFVDRDELSEMARWAYDAIAERGGHVYANDLFKIAENRPEKWSRGQVRRALRDAGVQNTREARRGGRSILYLPDRCTENEAKAWGTVPAEGRNENG